MNDPIPPKPSAPTCATGTDAAARIRKTLFCHICGSTDLRSEHCKVFCRKCNHLVENCSGD
ncbi:MAG: hypothetical protein AB1405_13240 [Bdellovibrionota bacterium]